MRLEEICRLRPGIDITIKNAMPCFDIAPREGWDPKTEAGTRIIPIHSWLIRHGFMDFVKQQRAEPPNTCSRPNWYCTRRNSAQDSVASFRRSRSIWESAKNYVSQLPPHLPNCLESTDHKDSHIDAVMGHEGGGSEGRTYVKGVTTVKLKEVVEAFQPPLGLNFLGAAAAAAPPPSPKVNVKKRKLTPPVLDANGRVVRRR
jgi:hypothetical protein